MPNPRELHESRLGTTDELGRRVMPQPDDVQGKWTSRRRWLGALLIGFYLVLPWIYVDGKQWVLLDIPKREFTLFGTVFHAYDSVYLIFVLLGICFLAAFVTSVWGRAWCGWACPQTVFIDQVYRRIERLVEGNARKRKALNRAPFSLEKLTKKSLKWALFLIVSLHIVHSFLGYFVGTRHLLEISSQSPSNNWTLFLTMLSLTGITLFDFAWFREQFCVIACPYGRFQSVLMDESSTVILYDGNRGEPRRARDVPRDQEGDCINCFKCVKVCPTGIDIRRGTQMECVACANCIDACDEIMRKVGKKEGLIRYSNESAYLGKKKKVGARAYVYASFLVIVLFGAFTGLSKRQDLTAQFIRMPGAPFITSVVDGKKLVINRFEAKLKVIGKQGATLFIEIPEAAQEGFELVSGELPRKIKKDRESVSLFLKFHPNSLRKGSFLLPLEVKAVFPDGRVERARQEVKLVGPL